MGDWAQLVGDGVARFAATTYPRSRYSRRRNRMKASKREPAVRNGLPPNRLGGDQFSVGEHVFAVGNRVRIVTRFARSAPGRVPICQRNFAKCATNFLVIPLRRPLAKSSQCFT